VTGLVHTWIDGRAPNHELAIAPAIDPSANDGILSRFPLYSSENYREQYTPKLTVRAQPARR
jgi:hypothetical protein